MTEFEHMEPLDMIFDPRGTLERIAREVETHPSTMDCDDQECLICGFRDCPHSEPLHYHHDGCPACYFCAHKVEGHGHCGCVKAATA